jgi:hypothetical protein
MLAGICGTNFSDEEGETPRACGDPWIFFLNFLNFTKTLVLDTAHKKYIKELLLNTKI